MIRKHEVVIFGAGISGLTTAFQASQSCDVAVVSKVHVVRRERIVFIAPSRKKIRNIRLEKFYDFKKIDTICTN